MGTFFVLILATLAVGLLLLGLARSRKYVPLVQNLDESDYPLHEFIKVGFSLSSIPLFKLRGNLERELKRESRLYWNNAYYEYYAELTWAQFLTYAVLLCAFGLALAGLFNNSMTFVLVIVVVLGVAALWNLTISKMKEAVEDRKEECEYEFPNMVSKLALLINSGMILDQAWKTVAYGKKGPLYDLMRQACTEMENGASFVEAVNKFGIMSDSSEIKKFSSSIIQGMEKGSADLTAYLVGQTTELWTVKKQLALQRGEVAAGKLIIPLAFTFLGIILIIIAAALQSLTF